MFIFQESDCNGAYLYVGVFVACGGSLYEAFEFLHVEKASLNESPLTRFWAAKPLTHPIRLYNP